MISEQEIQIKNQKQEMAELDKSPYIYNQAKQLTDIHK